ncbi:MAG: urease accessory protein UreE [Pseudomonadota bacterium]
MVIETVLGRASDPPWHDRLHALPASAVDEVRLARVDAARKRLRLTSAQGRDVALSLDRGSTDIPDGAVLAFEHGFALLARVDGGPRLRLTPADAASAARLGWFCGNLHWKTDFEGASLVIHMDAPEESYRTRLVDAEALCAFAVQRLAPEGEA